ncbi:amidohydrolase 2, partial [Reticulomyxa filosa]
KRNKQQTLLPLLFVEGEIHQSSLYELNKSVHVQCFHDDPLEETRYRQDLYVQYKHPTAIIACIDLCDPNVETVIQQHQKLSSQFRGVRHCLDYHPKYKNRQLVRRFDVLMSPEFHHGLRYEFPSILFFHKVRIIIIFFFMTKKKKRSLDKHGLIFEMQIYPCQMTCAAVVAAAYPKLKIVINHCGFPLEEDMDIWKQGIALLSKCKNVYIKMSGGGKIAVFGIDNFGVDRVMFASDFPVDKIHGDYDMYWHMYISMLVKNHFDQAQIQKMVHSNAIHFYQLNGRSSKSKL